MGLLALCHWSRAKEPGWGFLGSQKMLSQKQLLLPTNSFNFQRDPLGWALPLPAPIGGSSDSWCLQKMAMSLMEPLCCVSAWPCPDPGERS